jgi:uncharacterized protein (DUF1800 family)
MDNNPIQALVRFGWRRRGSEPLPSDPRHWLAGQITAPDPGIQADGFADLPTSGAALAILREERKTKPPPGESHLRDIYRREAAALASWAVVTPAPFRERLVWFWANHFTVSVRGGGVAPTAGAYVREAIRPHVTGRFVDLLSAVMHHPTMLMYLDNVQSVGPDSPAGIKGKRGLNENLARESLELHTVSPAAGYSQEDVTAYARLITGWSVDMQADPPGFKFRPFAHQPGSQTVMGQSFPDGQEGGEAALRFLGTHPATYRHLALKLVRHFVADTPPPAAVKHVAGVLHDTGGDLGQASLALLRLPQAWDPLEKLRTPADFVIATVRALDMTGEQVPNLPGIMGGLGQPMWNAPFPIGWADDAASWTGSEALLRRIDWAYGISGRAAAQDAGDIATASLGPLLRPETSTAISRAGSRRDALALLFASPEFQRR